MPPRANSPLPDNNDLGALNPPTDEGVTPLQKLPKQYLDLAKAAKSANGKIILDHLQKRVDIYNQQLKSIDVVNPNPTTALAEILAAQMVIKEFESVLNDSKIAVKAVEDAAKQS